MEQLTEAKMVLLTITMSMTLIYKTFSLQEKSSSNTNWPVKLILDYLFADIPDVFLKLSE